MHAILYLISQNFACGCEIWSASQLLFLWQTGSRHPILEVCEFQFWQCRDCSCHVFLRILAVSRLHLIDPSSIEYDSACSYFFLLSFFFLLLTPNLWGHWTDLNQTGIHIPLWLLFGKIWSELPHIPPPHGLGAKTAVWDRLWTLTEHISATKHDINNRKETCQSTGSPLHALKFAELWSRNGWDFGEFLPTP